MLPKELTITVLPEDWQEGVESTNPPNFWGGSCALSQAIVRQLDFVDRVTVYDEGKVTITATDGTVKQYHADKTGKLLATVFDNAVTGLRPYTLRKAQTVTLRVVY